MAVSYSGLHPYLRAIVKQLPRVAKLNGFRYRITSAYRSPQKQAQLYREYLAGRAPYPVAAPGTSAHERGLALDVMADNPSKLVYALTAAGLSWAGPSDPVHFQLGGLESQATANSGGSSSFWTSFKKSSNLISNFLVGGNLFRS